MAASTGSAISGVALRDFPWRGIIVCFAGVIYPQWALLAPDSSTNPTWAWWVIGAALTASGLLLVLWPQVEATAEALVQGIGFLVTLQLMTLAAMNEMHPFFAVGSAMAIVSTALYLRSRSWLAAYVAWVAVLAGVGLALHPDPLMLAWWGGPLPLLALVYYRLHSQARKEHRARHQREELEQLVAARTADLTETNRRLQQEILERERLEREVHVAQKLEAVGRLAGSIAHDFNNIITTIGIYAELIRNALPEESRQRLDLLQIEDSAGEAAALVRGLLALSTPGTGETVTIDLVDVVETMSQLIRHVLGSNSELVLETANERCCTRANLAETRQVLLNLVLNARDAMPDGGVLTIEVRPSEVVPELVAQTCGSEGCSEFVVLAVSDTGIGMDSETQTRAFDPFFTTKSAARGTGFGLSTVYGTVKQRGGHVRIDSEPGGGARFELFLPRSSEPPSVRPGEATVPSTAGSERILLVEDETDLRRALRRVLEGGGYDVVEAADGEEALEAACKEGEHFDLVVSDVVMPRVSGIDLAEQLAATSSTIRVLLISGFTGHPTLDDRVLPKRAFFLAKPFSNAVLANKVREVLDAVWD